MRYDLAHRPSYFSNPAPDKSPIQKWIAKLTGAHGSGSATLHHSAHTVRKYGEAGIVGATLAAIEVYKPSMSDKVQVATAIGGALGSVWKATEEYATDLSNVGADAFTILAYRKSIDLISKKRAASGKVAGEFGDDVGEDTILEAAKEL